MASSTTSRGMAEKPTHSEPSQIIAPFSLIYISSSAISPNCS